MFDIYKNFYSSQVVLTSLCNLKYKGDICTSYLYYLCIVCVVYFLLIQLKTLVLCVHRNRSPNKHLQKLKLYSTMSMTQCDDNNLIPSTYIDIAYNIPR